MLTQVKPIVRIKEHSDDKPDKHETITYFRVCSTNCIKCDTKRTICCKKR